MIAALIFALILLTFILITFSSCLSRCRLHRPYIARPYANPTLALKDAATLAISELTYTIAILIERYSFISVCLAVPNPRTRNLGPLSTEYTTFHINGGVTHDLVERMIELLQSAQNDLEREEAAVVAFWEQWERSGGRMPRDEVARGVEMLTEWRDRRRGSIAREVVLEAEKYFGIDDGIVVAEEEEESTPQQTLDQPIIGATGGEVHDGGSGKSSRRRKGKKGRRRVS